MLRFILLVQLCFMEANGFIFSRTLRNYIKTSSYDSKLTHSSTQLFSVSNTSQFAESGTKTKKKAVFKPIALYNENFIKEWKLTENYNSTTLKLFFTFKEEFFSFWSKVENQFKSIRVQVASKVERDIRTTLGAGDFIKRTASKSTKKIAGGVDNFQRPLKSLPSMLQELTTNPDSYDMIRKGVMPSDKPSLMGGFSAVTTKQRSERIKRKKAQLKVPTGGVDSIYKTIKLLPKNLQYDYERKVVSRESKKSGNINRKKMLPDSVSFDDSDLEEFDENQFSRSPFLLGDGTKQQIFLNNNAQSVEENKSLQVELSTDRAVQLLFQLINSGKILKIQTKIQEVLSTIADSEFVMVLASNLGDFINKSENESTQEEKSLFNTIASNLETLQIGIEACEGLISLTRANQNEKIEIRKTDLEAVMEALLAATLVRDQMQLLKSARCWDKTVEVDGQEASNNAKNMKVLVSKTASNISNLFKSEASFWLSTYSILEPICDALDSAISDPSTIFKNKKLIEDSVMKKSSMILDDFANVDASGSPILGTITLEETETDHKAESKELKVRKSSSEFEAELVDYEFITDKNIPQISSKSVKADDELIIDISNGETSFAVLDVQQDGTVIKSAQDIKNVEIPKISVDSENELIFLDPSFVSSFSMDKTVDKIETSEDLIAWVLKEDKKEKIGKNQDPVVFETTAESVDTKEAQVIKVLVTTLDVSFFLVETIFRAAGPIVTGKGNLIVKRISETFYYSKFLNLFQNEEKIKKLISSKLKDSQEWKIFMQLKYSQERVKNFN